MLFCMQIQSHECAPHYTPSLFYMPGFLALGSNPSTTISAEMVEGWLRYNPNKTLCFLVSEKRLGFVVSESAPWKRHRRVNSLAAGVGFDSILN